MEVLSQLVDIHICHTPSVLHVNSAKNEQFGYLVKNLGGLTSSFKNYTAEEKDLELLSQHSDHNDSQTQFVSLHKPCIILKNGLCCPQEPQIKRLLNNVQIKREHKLSDKRTIQKQARNVGSNLLRIFFKSLLDLKSYDNIILLYCKKSSASVDKEHFYEWIKNFNINCRNYVKMSEIKRILDQKEPLQLKKLFMILLKKYCDGKGLLHSLTSRRMEKGATRMHISGLRQLWQDIVTLYYLDQ